MTSPQPDKNEVAFESHKDEVNRVLVEPAPDAGEHDSRLGWSEPGEFTDEVEDEIRARSAHVLHEIFLHITEKGELDTVLGIVRFAVRALMVVWVFAPHLVTGKNGKPLALAAIGKPLKRTRCWMSMEAEAISMKFKFLSRNQKPLSEREKYADAAVTGWETRQRARELDGHEDVPRIPATRRRCP